ncbi:MAG: DUF948 domain-containing protein [Parachlamydia sp.]|jgi:uncharacterized protein YoxC|nr:DUF948 domain-containing protein [Parachlamydia sp.]
MIIEISVAVIALAFALLVVYLIVLLKSLKGTLNQLNFFLFDARKQLDEIGIEAKKAAELANDITGDIKFKLDTLNPFFQSFENIGEVLENRVEKFKKQTEESAAPSFCRTHLCKDHCNEEKHNINETQSAFTPEIFQLVGLGVRLWHKLKKRS